MIDTNFDFRFLACADYSVHCPYWKNLGECEKNTWMSENCRKSCETCTSMPDLRELCQGVVFELEKVQVGNQKISILGPMAPRAKEIKWMKSQRRSGTISSGWWGLSKVSV